MPLMNTNSYLILLGTSLVVTYLAVRRGRVGVPGAVAVESMVNSLFIFLYVVVKGDGLIHALMVSLTLGSLFAVVSVVLSASFRRQSLQATTTDHQLVPLGEVPHSI